MLPTSENESSFLPTPQARDWKGHNPCRDGGLDLPGAVGQLVLFPTPSTHDATGHRKPEQKARHRPFSNLNDTAVNDLGALLPTPEAKSSTAGPDFARATRPGSGGDDLVTTVCKATRGQLDWGKYQPAIDRWESLTREAPYPVEPNTKGQPRLSARFAEWMMGWPEGWVTDLINPEPRRKVEGTVSRSAALKMVGNGVVPQQAAAALRLLKDSLDNERKVSA